MPSTLFLAPAAPPAGPTRPRVRALAASTSSHFAHPRGARASPPLLARPRPASPGRRAAGTRPHAAAAVAAAAPPVLAWLAAARTVLCIVLSVFFAAAVPTLWVSV
jgi:hypothetical protein